MKKSIWITAVVAILALSIAGLTAGCQKKEDIGSLTDEQIKAAKKAELQAKKNDAKDEGGMWRESNLPPDQAKKIKKEIEAGFKKAIDVWTNTKGNPESFKKGLTGKALLELEKQTKNESAQGKIKIRVHDNSEFEVVKVKETAGAVAYVYIDNGYYIDAKTKKPISKPSGAKKEWLIGIGKYGKVWKISNIVPLRPNDPSSGSLPPGHKTQ